jgi:hypothetical protein
MRYVTKWAPSGAEVAQNHKSRGTFAKALAYVWTGRFFADRVKFLFPQYPFDLIKLLAVR